MESALKALRRREISANKAAKIYKIPSSVSTMYHKLSNNLILAVFYAELGCTTYKIIFFVFNISNPIFKNYCMSDVIQNCTQGENRISPAIQRRNNYLDTGENIVKDTKIRTAALLKLYSRFPLLY